MVRIPWSMRTEAYNLRVCSNILLSVETIANEWKTIDILYVELMYRKYVPSHFFNDYTNYVCTENGYVTIKLHTS